MEEKKTYFRATNYKGKFQAEKIYFVILVEREGAKFDLYMELLQLTTISSARNYSKDWCEVIYIITTIAVSAWLGKNVII